MRRLNLTVSCDHCNGTGQARLTDALAEVLWLLKFNKKHQGTASTIHPLIANSESFGVTAINVRLEELRALKLVTRTRMGKCWKYSVVETTTNTKQKAK